MIIHNIQHDTSPVSDMKLKPPAKKIMLGIKVVF